MTLASFINRYEEHGGGDLPSFSWTWEDAPPCAQTGEVETLDGFVLALSPWAVRSIRFDESLGRFHGYDLDYCLQVREAGRKVRDGRLPRHPPPPDRDAPGPGGVDRGAHRGRGEVGRPDAAASAPRRAAGASVRCAPRPSATPPRAMAHTKVLELEARARELERGSPRRARASPGGSRSAAVARAARRAGGRRCARRASPDDRVRLRDRRPGGVPALRRARASGARPSPDSVVYAFAAVGTVCRGYNLLLDSAAAPRRPRGARARRRARRDRRPRASAPRLRDGAARPGRGGRRLRRRARRPHDRVVGGRGELRRRSSTATTSTAAARWPATRWAAPGAPLGEVDSVDGLLLVLSPWAVRTLRFDESLSHRATATTSTTASRSARPAARWSPRTSARSTTARSSCCADRERLGRGAHHGGREVGRPLAGPQRRAGATGRRRARRAEAEREAARTMAYSSALRVDARGRWRSSARWRTMTESVSWRVTAPLRRLNRAAPPRVARRRS